MEPINEIAARIRELREVCDYTVEQLASELGLSAEQYAAYEQNGDFPISVIYEIANKFNVDFNELITGEPSRIDTFQVVRRGQGRSISRFPGYRFKDLAFRYADKIMQPLLVTLEPSDEPAKLVTHSGQEFNLVLKGTVAVVFEDKEIILNEGDSIYFNPTYPHGQRCAGDTKARFLTMIAE
ncbi:MAG: helix-turn-helix transcriptional regulator [Oscillospiraceae bacterium]|jgi:transcriptional regulator with XRE-family HTH domain|nr:helix-turn-helix transcriptional regulator [Oscillospiraceae bacterium]MBQ5338352.1 helix-turn-helix transcriptional regulator [Oscillospiraceae bacterium]MBQ9905696.1 helix-turn-helix transcriptional regulator [Oscillospiraceae bacterium]